MSKRTINSKTSTTKKPRIDESNDFWDDDFDGAAVDDCFKRATQVCEEDKNVATNDVSLLSSYSIFKERTHFFTSTQSTQPIGEGVGVKIKQLQEKYAEKEGEVSILRSNLEHLRTTCETDQKRKEVEWRERIFGFEKENKTIKSELEFKNLEIVNLKQQIAELSKYVNVEQNFTQKSQFTDNKFPALSSPEKHVKTVSCGNPRIYVNVEKYYPLKSYHFPFTSNRIQDKRLNFNKTSNCYLQDKWKLKKMDFCNLMENFEAAYVYQELLPVINLSTEDLSSDKSILYLNKVLYFSTQLLKNFYDYLKLIEVEMRSKQNGEFDTQFLQSTSSKISEASLMCSEIVTLLGEIIPFSPHLKSQLLSEQISHFDEIPPFHQDFLTSGSLDRTQTLNCVTLLSDVISVIGRANFGEYCREFLFAVMKLLCRIYSTENLDSIRQSTVEEILNRLLLLNTDFELVYQMNFFLNIVTHHPNFIYFLCPNNKNLKDKPVKVSCRLHGFITLLEDIVTKTQNEKSFFRVSSNILSFTYNIFKSDNVWLHQQENKTCECLRKLCKLTVGIIYKNSEMYETANSIERSLLKNRVTLLNLLTFNAYDLTQKYVTDFANFKEIVYRLTHTSDKMDHANLNKLEKLSTTEELPEVPKEKFIQVNL